MMMTICDRCRVPIENQDKVRKLTLGKPLGGIQHDRVFDLCNDCAGALGSWIHDPQEANSLIKAIDKSVAKSLVSKMEV
jgi:hypothetical protein